MGTLPGFPYKSGGGPGGLRTAILPDRGDADNPGGDPLLVKEEPKR